MKEHIDQVAHNLDFLAALDKQFPKRYFDWRITVAFYTALHCLRAYEKFKKVRIAKGHKFLYEHSNPSNPSALNPISQKAFDAYNELHDASQKTRYQGFLNPMIHMVGLELTYTDALQNLDIVKNYVKSKGVKF